MIVIGDLHGSYFAFSENLKHCGITKLGEDLSKNNSLLIFLGDILADRHPQSIEIIKEIMDSRTEGMDDNIVALVGNHDAFVAKYLLCRKRNDIIDLMNRCIMPNGQGLGITELSLFVNKGIDFTNITDIGEVYKILINKKDEILEGMRKSELGRKVLQFICTSKILYLKDDTLFLHTNPTQKMMDWLLQFMKKNGLNTLEEAINEINSLYQTVLNEILINEKKPEEIDKNVYKKFEDIFEIFLHTENRITFNNPAIAENLRELGVNAIIHGHTGDDNSRVQEIIKGFLVLSVDFKFGQTGHDNGKRSTAIIKKDGSINIGAENTLVRGLEGNNTPENSTKLNQNPPKEESSSRSNQQQGGEGLRSFVDSDGNTLAEEVEVTTSNGRKRIFWIQNDASQCGPCAILNVAILLGLEQETIEKIRQTAWNTRIQNGWLNDRDKRLGINSFWLNMKEIEDSLSSMGLKRHQMVHRVNLANPNDSEEKKHQKRQNFEELLFDPEYKILIVNEGSHFVVYVRNPGSENNKTNSTWSRIDSLQKPLFIESAESNPLKRVGYRGDAIFIKTSEDIYL